MSPPPDDPSAEERAHSELDKLRDRLQEDSKRLISGIRRIQIVNLIALAILCLVLRNEDLRPPKWAPMRERIAEWKKGRGIHVSLRAVEYSHIADYDLTQDRRKALTASILKTGLDGQIRPEANLSQVSEFLADKLYGIDFIDLDDLEKYLSLMLEQPGATVLQDLSRYNYQGGVNPVTGTSLRDAFFADYTLGKHKVLAEHFPYVPGRPIRDYVESMRSFIGGIKQKYPDADKAWSELRTGYLHKFTVLGGWTWAAWIGLTDSTVLEWNSIVADSVGAIDTATIATLRGNSTRLDWGSVIDWVESQVAQRVKAEGEAETKATFWSVTVAVPLKAMLLLFPLIAIAARCVLAEFRLHLKCNLARMSAIDVAIDRGLRSYGPLLAKLRVRLTAPIVMPSSWKGFTSFSLSFTEVAYEMATFLMAAYVLYRSGRLAYFSPESWIYPITFSAVILLAALLGTVFVKSSRSAAQNASESVQDPLESIP